MVNQQTVTAPAGRRAPALSAADLAVLRASLREQRAFRRRQLRALTAGAGGPSSAGRAEAAARAAACARMVLADVEAALDRMDRGGYGVCGLCRGPVSRACLMVVPQVRYCARCRPVREAGR